MRQKVTPFLWFNGQAEEAAALYTSLVPDSAVTSVTPGPDGKAMLVEFRLGGGRFLALNGGPQFQFSEAVSLVIECDTQAEIDDLWERLSAGGAKLECGWVKDKYGLAWQIVPAVLPKLMADPAAGGRVMAALMTMAKLDIRALEAAAAGN